MSDSKTRIDQALKSLAFDFCGSPQEFVAEARRRLSIAVDPNYAAELIEPSRQIEEHRRRIVRR